MDHHGTAAAAATGRKGKVKPAGHGSVLASAFIPVGRRSGSPAGPFPVGRESSTSASLFPINGGNVAASASSSMAIPGMVGSCPIGGFTSQDGGSFTGTTSQPAGFPFPPSPSSLAWWGSDGSSPAFQPSDPRDKDTQGVMRYFGNQPHNFHLVGAPSHNSHVNISIPETNDRSLPSEVEILSEQNHVLVNDENENIRTEKRIMWTPKEDEQLMSAWIENSTDSTTGADRKGEAYWGEVIKAYNKVIPPQRKRNAKQAKDQWHKINRWCFLFECDYVKARRVFTSGYSDEMWIDAAEKFYEEHKLGPFVIKNVWKICRKVPKWITYNEELKNARKRKLYPLEEDVQNVESEDEMLKRPMGQKATKNVALAAKGKTKAIEDDGKSKESAINVEKLDKWSKMQEESNANRMKVLELQQKLSSDKIETTRLAHLTARE